VEFERALVVFAHPDDAEFLCGGTVATWAKGGTEVHYVCATDGSAGWNGPDRSRDEIARIREAEMREAANVLGVRSVTFLGFVDGTLEATLQLRKAITREVRRLRPELLLTNDPSLLWSGRRYVNHPDHRAVGEAVLAVVACDAPTRPQFPELLEEGLEPHKVPRLWLPTWDGADTYVDISDAIDLKVEALHRHKSQMENMGMDDVDDRVREWAADLGKERDVKYAEAFRTFDLNDE
jgi:LmbE family N-acetylglucosaminyl deacetylase